MFKLNFRKGLNRYLKRRKDVKIVMDNINQRVISNNIQIAIVRTVRSLTKLNKKEYHILKTG